MSYIGLFLGGGEYSTVFSSELVNKYSNKMKYGKT